MTLTPDYSHIPEAISFALGLSGRHCLKSPTGSGKTSIGCGIYQADPEHTLILAPSDEILDGWARKLGLPDGKRDREKHNLFTYYRALSCLGNGSLDPSTITRVIQDEAHHLDETNVSIDAYLGNITKIGLTATDYRGTPYETKRFLEYYDYHIHKILDIETAAKRRVISIPTFEVVPLINDDLIDVQRGQFNVRQVESFTKNKLDDIEALIRSRYYDGARYKRPIMLTFNSVASCLEAKERFQIPCEYVTGETKNRRDIFDRVVRCETLLIQVKVVGEGVDLPIRVLVDAAPTVSPVLWMQRVGRITRPVGKWCRKCRKHIQAHESCCTYDFRADTAPHDPNSYGYVSEPPPEYICTNHNLLRHAYLFEGYVPSIVFKDYKKKWDGWEPSGRAASRVIGEIKSLGRFKPADVPLSDGTFAMGMVLDDPSGRGHQYAVLMHPATDKMIVARRDWTLDNEGKRDYNKGAKWTKVQELPDLTGYTSVPNGPLTPAQKAWWERSADAVGLDPKGAVTNKSFQFLPILLNLKLRIKV